MISGDGHQEEVGRLWEAETPAVCGGQACSMGPETQSKGGSLKDLSAMGGVPERQGLEGVLSAGQRAGG